MHRNDSARSGTGASTRTKVNQLTCTCSEMCL